jgi:hypothetical protein
VGRQSPTRSSEGWRLHGWLNNSFIHSCWISQFGAAGAETYSTGGTCIVIFGNVTLFKTCLLLKTRVDLFFLK